MAEVAVKQEANADNGQDLTHGAAADFQNQQQGDETDNDVQIGVETGRKDKALLHLDLVVADIDRQQDHGPVNDPADVLDLGGVAQDDVAANGAPVNSGEDEGGPGSVGSGDHLENTQRRSDAECNDIYKALVSVFGSRFRHKEFLSDSIVILNKTKLPDMYCPGSGSSMGSCRAVKNLMAGIWFYGLLRQTAAGDFCIMINLSSGVARISR